MSGSTDGIGKADVLVFFGATGDLARRKIYPALFEMVRKGKLDIPIIGVSRPTRDERAFKQMVRESLGRAYDTDRATSEKLLSLVHFVGGNYEDETTYRHLAELTSSYRRPAYYLAIPPSLFGTVAMNMAHSGCSKEARLIVEKPFGRDLKSAQELDEALHQYFPESSIYRIDHYLGKESVQNLVYFHLANQMVDSTLHRSCVERVEITVAETLGMEGRGHFYEEVGAMRDVLQNHMLQVIACLGMECPVRMENEEIRNEKARVIKAVRPMVPEDIVRAQYVGYRQEPGVASSSNVETYAAARLFIDNDRWDGVPFFVRVGKRLPVSCAEVYVKYKAPLWAKIMETNGADCGNYLRLRLSPNIEIAQGTQVKKAGTELVGNCVELLANYAPPDEMMAYERLFLDVIAGNTELFARKDIMLAQWRVVENVLDNSTPLYFYEPGTWGPREADVLMGPTAWHNPVVPNEPAELALFQETAFAQGPSYQGRQLPPPRKRGRIEIVDSAAAVDRTAAMRFTELAQKAIAERGRFTVAFPGGRSPVGALQILASPELARGVTWDKVHVFWVDERCVPPTDAQSNYRLVNEHLLSKVAIPEPNVHRIRGEEDPTSAAASYERELRKWFGEGPRGLDLAWLGLGEDAHIASLFPNQPTLQTSAWVVSAEVEAAVPRRITLSVSFLNRSAELYVLAEGFQKAEAVALAIGVPFNPSLVPAQLLDPPSGHLVWLIDRAAASRLEPVRHSSRATTWDQTKWD